MIIVQLFVQLTLDTAAVKAYNLFTQVEARFVISTYAGCLQQRTAYRKGTDAEVCGSCWDRMLGIWNKICMTVAFLCGALSWYVIFHIEKHIQGSLQLY
mgnify:CR=1 FL=1